jgi:hypothetical protein
MSVLALMAAGAHVLAITSPALAEQARQKRVAASETERSVMPNAPTAASDGLPVPALAGGVVLAFAVGLGAGHVHRRRRRAGAQTSRTARRAAAHPPAPRVPAPTPPEPAAPAPPVVVAAPAPPPAPVPPPPQPRAPEPRVVAPQPTPAPPPPRPRPPARRAVPAPHAKLGEAPEVPRPQNVDPALRKRSTPRLDVTPEALRPPGRRPPAQRPSAPPAPPARRFARLVPWPEDAAQLWTCEIDWKAGYRKSSFRAMVEPPGGGKRRQIAESPPLRWSLMMDPEPPTPEFITLARALMTALEAAGWERIGPGGPWYAQRFLWRGVNEPGPVVVPDTQTAEPPPR